MPITLSLKCVVCPARQAFGRGISGAFTATGAGRFIHQGRRERSRSRAATLMTRADLLRLAWRAWRCLSCTSAS